jgi:hypothetical protein
MEALGQERRFAKRRLVVAGEQKLERESQKKRR